MTWSDWTEGSQVELGVEKDVTLATTIHGSTLRWTIAGGTGDESTIDHYEIRAPADGINAADLGAVPAGQHAFELQSVTDLAAGTNYKLIVDAVGRPCIRDHVSSAVTFSPERPNQRQLNP